VNKFATRAVHTGEGRRSDFTPISTPIYSSATFIYDEVERIDRVAGGEPGYMYSRYSNPTGVAFEEAVASLEEAEAAFSFGSGMAAMHAAILASGVKAGDTVFCSQAVYGATLGLLHTILAPLGITVRLGDFSSDGAWKQLADIRPRLVIVETISNPLLRVVDLGKLAKAVHAAAGKLLVDSTFATPVLCRPLALGADYVVHSATKYFGGHGDAMGGVVLARAGEGAGIYEVRKLVGGILGPFEAWLLLRGLKTLHLRVERQCSTAMRLAEFLSTHPKIERVIYPGLASHPDHLHARTALGGYFGGVLSFEIRGARKPEVMAFMNRLQLCLPGTSLGDVQSLLLYPVMSSHRDLSPQQREHIGVRENLVRLSAGIEDAGDLMADIEQALGA